MAPFSNQGNSTHNPISIDDSDSDSDTRDTTYKRSAATSGATAPRTSNTGSSLNVPRASAVAGPSRSRSHISIDGSSAGMGSPAPDPKKSAASAKAQRDRQTSREKEREKKGKKAGHGSSRLDEDRPRSRSQVQREKNRQNVIEILDSDDDVSPPPPTSRPAASTSTSPIKGRKPLFIPKADLSRDRDVSLTPSSASPTAPLFPSTAAAGPSSTPARATVAARPNSAKKAMKGRISMADKPHLSMSPDDPGPAPLRKAPVADTTSIFALNAGSGSGSGTGAAAAAKVGLGEGPTAFDPVTFSPSTIRRAKEARVAAAESTTAMAGNPRAEQLSRENDIRADAAEQIAHAEDERMLSSSPPPNPVPRHHKRPPSPLIGHLHRPKYPAGQARRRIVESSSEPSSPMEPIHPIVRSGLTEPKLFPQSAQAGPSGSGNHAGASAAAVSWYRAPSPGNSGPGAGSDDILDCIPRAGPSGLSAQTSEQVADPDVDSDVMLPDLDAVDLGARLARIPQRGAQAVDADGDILMSSPVFRAANLTEAQVEEAIVDATHGVDEVEITDASSPAVGPTVRQGPGIAGLKMREKMAQMTRAEKMALLDRGGEEPETETERRRRSVIRKAVNRSPGNDEASSVENVELTITNTWDFKPASSTTLSVPSSPEMGIDVDEPDFHLKGSTVPGVPGPEHPPDEYRGTVRRHFVSGTIDAFNLLKPSLTHNPALHRKMFQDWMSRCSAESEPFAKEIGVINHTTGEGGGAAPEMEYEYGNEMMYHPDVPDPDTGMGCGCIGPCNPEDQTCRCVRRQELYFYDTKLTGFAYNENGTTKNLSVPVWECGPNCGCPPSCMNRVIQRGRGKYTELDLIKTKNKGWGVQARYDIPSGTFLGIYSGELIPDYESERRGYLYNQIGRTYLFDCDGWQIRNPPDLDQLREVDPRLADLAEQSVKRYEAVLECAGETEMDTYSAYSIDAFHYGNFTRYFNHSCDPNLQITQAYVGDYHPERPKLVIFTRRPVAKGDELCISYMGVPDEDEQPVQRAPAPKPSKARNKGGRRNKNKTSALAHVAGSIRPGTDGSKCRCLAKNCTGQMFNAYVPTDN